MNNFPENVKNGFVLTLWLKKGGGLIRKGVLYAGFYGNNLSKTNISSRILMPKSRKISTNKSTGCVLVHSFCDLPRSPKGNLATQAALQAKQHVVMPSLSLTGVGGGEGP